MYLSSAACRLMLIMGWLLSNSLYNAMQSLCLLLASYAIASQIWIWEKIHTIISKRCLQNFLAICFLIQLTQKELFGSTRDITSPPRREEGRMIVSAASKNSIERPYIPFPYAFCPNSNICFAVSLLSACSFATCKAHATKCCCPPLFCKQLKLQPPRCVTNGR